MNVPPYISASQPELAPRQWRASLALRFSHKAGRTVLKDNKHSGPLRVQRPFYPEGDCCHVYLLHPPGGLVLGDKLSIDVVLDAQTSALITTPSAGKVYGVAGLGLEQKQVVKIAADEGACMEWLPQETIVFNGANARLETQLVLGESSRAMAWDMICLGRPAANEAFTQGRCDQTIQVQQNGKLILLERNRFIGGDPMLSELWGLGGALMSGTFLATVVLTQQQLDQLREILSALAGEDQSSRWVACRWSATQKNNLILVRYLGSSSRLCRQGFERVWCFLRPLVLAKPVALPRIWNT